MRKCTGWRGFCLFASLSQPRIIRPDGRPERRRVEQSARAVRSMAQHGCMRGKCLSEATGPAARATRSNGVENWRRAKRASMDTWGLVLLMRDACKPQHSERRDGETESRGRSVLRGQAQRRARTHAATRRLRTRLECDDSDSESVVARGPKLRVIAPHPCRRCLSAPCSNRRQNTGRSPRGSKGTVVGWPQPEQITGVPCEGAER